MALDSTASAHWEGDLMSGQGTTTLTSGAGGPFAVDWKARSEEHDGKTSPEELIAAAHATCFSMSLSILFDPAQHPPGERQVETRQSVTSLLQASPVGCLLSLLPTPGCVQVHPGGRSKIVGQEIEQP